MAALPCLPVACGRLRNFLADFGRDGDLLIIAALVRLIEPATHIRAKESSRNEFEPNMRQFIRNCHGAVRSQFCSGAIPT